MVFDEEAEVVPPTGYAHGPWHNMSGTYVASIGSVSITTGPSTVFLEPEEEEEPKPVYRQIPPELENIPPELDEEYL